MRDAATEKFAALLRELKQRSGRSYGSLATRLHVSTSTLHRYCNGDAVPSSYAPAERFARLCGATPEELVELHRRWHRAHGTRRGATPSWAAGDEPRPAGRGARPPKSGTPAAGTARGGTNGRPTGTTRAPGPGVRGSGEAARGGAAAGRGGVRGRSSGAADGAAGAVKGTTADAPAAGGSPEAGTGRPARGSAATAAARTPASGGGGGHGGGAAADSGAQPPAADASGGPAARANAADDRTASGAQPTGAGGAGEAPGTSAAHAVAAGESSGRAARGDAGEPATDAVQTSDRRSRSGDAPPSDNAPPSGDAQSSDDAQPSGDAQSSDSAVPSGGSRTDSGDRRPRWARVLPAARGAGPPGRPKSAAALRSRRLRVGLPVAAVATATALVAFVATSSGSGGEGRAGGGEGRESGVVAEGSRGGGRAQGGETTEKEESAEPSERRKPSPAGGGAEQDGEPATPRKGGGTAQEDEDEPAARNPLAWSVRSHVWEFGCDHRYLVDKSPGDVPPPPMAQDAETWAASQGAVHGGRTNIEAAIEPRGGEPVTVTAVHVRKTASGAPLPWSAFAMSSGCGGEVTEAAYSVDLDMPRPVLKPRQGGDSTGKWDPPALPYRVTPDDPLSLLVRADAEDHDVRWYLEVEWSTGTDSGVVRIDDQGAPFRTSGIKDRPLYDYDTLDGSWYTWPTDDAADESAAPAQ
ncbi:helix-turn-helix domain-containing protein [Streptomyces aculeolatus]